jgi:Alpha/beta hydrolase family
MMASTILFVPGLWEGPSVFDSLSSLLAADGFNTEVASLPSTGTISPGNPTMKDDIAAIRQRLVPLVSRGDNVLLVLHSAGGFLGSEAMQGLDVKQRRERGEKGGVVGIVFLTAGLIPEGFPHQTPPFWVIEVSWVRR